MHQDMIALSKHRDTKWIKVDSPKYHKGEIPTRRICYLSELDLWEECKVPPAWGGSYGTGTLTG